MPQLTVDVPEAMYAAALRAIADLLDSEGSTSQPAASDDSKVDQGLPLPWRFVELIPGDFTEGDIARLAGFYKRLSIAGRRTLDLLLLFREMHQDDLAKHLGVVGTSGLAGLMGHITKTANGIDRVSPVVRNAEAKTYGLSERLGTPLRQASLYAYCPTSDATRVDTESLGGWILEPNGDDHFADDYDEEMFIHRFPYMGSWWEVTSSRPYRYIQFETFLKKVQTVDGAVVPGLYRSREEITQEDEEVFHDSSLGLEFFPDHEHQVLVGHSTNAFNQLWPHDNETVYAQAISYPRPVESFDELESLSGEKLPLHESFGAIEIGPPEGW